MSQKDKIVEAWKRPIKISVQDRPCVVNNSQVQFHEQRKITNTARWSFCGTAVFEAVLCWTESPVLKTMQNHWWVWENWTSCGPQLIDIVYWKRQRASTRADLSLVIIVAILQLCQLYFETYSNIFTWNSSSSIVVVWLILKTTVLWVETQFGTWYLYPVGFKKQRERSPSLARNTGNLSSWVSAVEKFSFILFPPVLTHVVQCKLVPNISCTSVYGF